MSEFEFDASDFIAKLTVSETQALGASLIAVQDSVDDLKRISSEIAPISMSGLRKSVKGTVELDPKGIMGVVSFSVTETSAKGRFNYALWTHEQDYELGEQSQAAPGTDGYHVGNKYLERPLKGESDKYVSNWAKAIAGAWNK